MATDYILFIHGVNTREDIKQKQSRYADTLFNLLRNTDLERDRVSKKIALYWGDINDEAENLNFRLNDATQRKKNRGSD
jgi:hypothetical protein